ncbi:hypothetical protein [Aquisphaera insulae]|uniref:hypothetical protein n=1 Tax=Aquisphaera insulae TaxID=2712864 RepID=UPI0013EACBB5|nr:hypothetical protein [Aquisphaera insulae]
MKRPARIAPALFAAVLAALALGDRAAMAQLSASDEERLQILSDPEAAKAKVKDEKARPPFEFFRSQFAPFDILPFIKPRTWNTVTLELRANEADYEGSLQFQPVALPGMPQAVVYARDARLTKEQRSRLSLQVMVQRPPDIKSPTEIGVELIRPGAIRADEAWPVPLKLISPNQMLVVIMSKESSSQYAAWNRYPCFMPSSIDPGDAIALDLNRYYRLVMPEHADRPFLSPHPLTWGSISHVIWDGLAADSVPVSHQQAMLDWLHWGGQLVLVGGAGPSLTIFRDSFLQPYLPADPDGQDVLLGEADLKPLAAAYRPGAMPVAPPQDGEEAAAEAPPRPAGNGRAYQPVAPLRPPPKRPVLLTGLKPRAGASRITLGEGSDRLLAVDGRVGRGRITMLAVNPTEPTLAAWPGIDTLVRRVVLRRPEEPLGGLPGVPTEARLSARGMLEAVDLSWYRITSRDHGAEAQAEADRLHSQDLARIPVKVQIKSPRVISPTGVNQPSASNPPNSEAEEAAMARAGIAEWRDTAPIPRLCRDALEKASGITVPSSWFVLRVIAAYLLAIVPLNWLVFRMLLNRREWAWAVVPLLSLGFAMAVERMAAYDMGYDSACDEVDLLEVHGGYPRAHLSRFGSLYTTGRERYTVAFPDNPLALAMPFNSERSIGGEEASTAVCRSYPVPALEGYAVQPRSLALYRAEEYIDLPGAISLKAGAAGQRTLINASEMELRDAILIEHASGGRVQTRVGTIAPGASAEVGPAGSSEIPEQVSGFDGPDPSLLLGVLRRSSDPLPEAAHEIRLVAWTPGPRGGQSFEPALDRHRGVTLVLVHLRQGDAPAPDGLRYNLLADESLRKALDAPARTPESPPRRPRR